MKQPSFPTEFERVCPSPDKGLSSEEVLLRVQCGKTNAVKRKSSKSYLKIFRDNLLTFFNFLGLVCFIALISVHAEQLGNYAFVVIFSANITIGIVQEIKAKLTVEKLSIVKESKIKVVRDGKVDEILAKDLVPDDIVRLSAGDQIPADCILLSGVIQTDESLLTGESVPVGKEENSELLSGSFIVSGACVARVDKVGEECYVQTLTKKAKRFKRTHSELLSSANLIIKTIGVLIIPIAIATALMQYNKTKEVYPTVTATTSVIIGMIPAGMIFLLTLALAYGIIKLARKNTLVQDMYSMEMLARVDTLCFDKTGTITDGNMSVFSTLPLSVEFDEHKIICSMQAALIEDNPTDRALKAYFKSDEILSPVKTLPFSSERKYSAVTFEEGTFVLGAPEFVMKNLPAEIAEVIGGHTGSGRRVLLLAKAEKIADNEVIGELIPLSVIALEDHIRPTAIKTIEWFYRNEVDIKVISGDNALTASKIAERAGVKNADKYISLAGLTDEEVVAAATEYTVFGRVSPDQKALLIKAMKQNGKTVVMTGDGVNDLISMKEADCAISIASATAAAKQLSHIVLLDNNFDSLPAVVKEGRRVINNIQQSSSLYLMKTLFTMVFAVISVATVSRYPFSPNMILPLEFFIIGLPSLFLSLQPNDERVKGKFIAEVFSRAVPGAVILVVNALLAKYYYIFGFDLGYGVADSLIVFSLVFGGYTFLLLLCLPLNNYRFYLIAAVSILVILCLNFCDVSLFGVRFFSFPSLSLFTDLPAIIFLLCLILIDIPIYYIADVVSKKVGLKARRSQKL